MTQEPSEAIKLVPLAARRVHIIREVNCYERPSLVDRARMTVGLTASRDIQSVWLAFPPYDHACDDHDYTVMGTRILGPVPGEQAESVIRQLSAAFVSAGFEVMVEDAADD